MSSRLTQGPMPTKRIEFIDAMRGFTIFLVVLSHVAMFCVNATESRSLISEYCDQVMNQLFFLVSGFVIYKAGEVWNLDYVVRFFKKRITVLLLFPLLFFLAYMHVNGFNILEGFFHEPKHGYWYTYTLFIFLVFYACARFCLRERVAEVVLVVLGVCFLPSGWPVLISHIPLSEDVLCFFCFSHWQYFLFFVLGVLIRKYYSAFQRLLDQKWLLPLCIAVYFFGNAFGDVISVPNAIKNLPIVFAALIVVFAFFRKKEDLFSQRSWVGRSMQFVGRRTLDVYLIHYFLLPVNFGIVVTVFVDHSMPFLEFVVATSISILIILMSLLIGSIIRLSPFLAHWAFGAKQR